MPRCDEGSCEERKMATKEPMAQSWWVTLGIVGWTLPRASVACAERARGTAGAEAARAAGGPFAAAGPAVVAATVFVVAGFFFLLELRLPVVRERAGGAAASATA